MTPQEFAAKVKAKYPQYANLSDAQLTARMVAKYPQYKSQINFSPTLQAKNALGGALSDIKSAASSAASQAAEGFNISNTATNPFDLIRGAAKMGAGAANIVFSPLAPVMAPVGAAVNAVADKVSDIPAVQDFALSRGGKALSTGVDFAADLNTVAGAVAAVKTPAAPRTTAPAKGAPTPFNLLRTEAKTPTASIPKAAPTFSESTMQRVARISPAKQVAFKERSGVSVGKYLTDRGIYGDAPQVAETLASRWMKSKEIVDQELGNLPGTYKNAALGSMVKELMQREQAVSSVGAPSPELGIVSQLYKKLKGEGLTMNEVNTVKRLYESRVKLGYLKENNSNAIAKATNLDTKIRTWQADTASQLGFKNIGELNKETSLAYQLANDIGEAHMGRMANNAVSLTDWIVLAGGDPKAVSAFMAKKLMSNGKVQASVAKAFGPKVSVPEPSAQIAAPTIENYKNFTTRTTRTPLPRPQTEMQQSLPTSIAQNEPNAGLGGLLNSAKSTVSNLVDNAKNNGQRGFVRIGGDSSPTTAPRPSRATNTSTGNAPIGKEGVSAQKADTSVPFDGAFKDSPVSLNTAQSNSKFYALAKQLTPDGVTIGKGNMEPEYTGFHHGQSDGYFPAYDANGKKVGFIDFTEFDNKVEIRMVEVDPSMRGKGLGKALVAAVQKEFPTSELQWSYMTKDGEALKASYEKALRGVSTTIPKELQGLAAEARKFKTAEEFVSSYKKSIKSQAAFEDYLDTFNSGVKDGDKLRGDLFSDAYFRRTTLPQKELISTEITDGSRVRYWKAKIQGGDRTPVLVDKTDNGYTITDGNHKLQAYKSLKINDVPVIIRYETDQLADLWHKATGK